MTLAPPTQVLRRVLPESGGIPNHPVLPLVIMRGTPAAMEEEAAEWLESAFLANGWSGVWRWTVYPFHHFHSNTHEVLGVCRGEAELCLGGEGGENVSVTQGDVLVIPAGVGHCRLGSSEDFQVVGAYPDGKHPDILRPHEAPLEEVLARVVSVPLPTRDPIYGTRGPLTEAWKP